MPGRRHLSPRQAPLDHRHVLIHLGEVIVERVVAREFELSAGRAYDRNAMPPVAIEAVATDVIGMSMGVHEETHGLVGEASDVGDIFLVTLGTWPESKITAQSEPMIKTELRLTKAPASSAGMKA